VFGFTRNVLARAISQYRYLTHFMPECRRVPWGEFCADPFALGDVCRQAELTGRTCCQQSSEHQYVHVLPQAHCFTTATNESVSEASPCCVLGSCGRRLMASQCSSTALLQHRAA